jgi:arginyl-tRNA synthetase
MAAPTSFLPLRARLSQIFSGAFQTEGFDSKWGEVSFSDRPDLAHFQCNGALGSAKQAKKNPREVAQAVLARVTPELDGRAALSIAGPGFINVVFHDAALAEELNLIPKDGREGVPSVSKVRNVVIDYGGPNVAKSMHVGHLRSSIIGDALCRLHRFAGDKVVGDNHIGDWGLQMGMLIEEVKARFPTLPYFDSNKSSGYPSESPVTIEDLERWYPEASKRCKESPEHHQAAIRATDELQKGRPGYRALWEHFVATTRRELERDFAQLGIRFDTWLGESFYEAKMPALVERMKKMGITEVSDGALIIRVATEKEPEMPPVILEKSGGGYLYHTSDLATVEHRVKAFEADLALYVVDKRQSLHFKQVFGAAHKAGLAPHTLLVHTPFGTMNGKDGKPFKTREGGVLKLKDLIEQTLQEARSRVTAVTQERGYSAEETDAIARKVAVATLRYADLKNNRAIDYVFDLERFSSFEGNTGPYLLYAAVRIQSILKKAAEQGFQPGPVIAAAVPQERALILELFKLPDAVRRAYDLSEPHHLADYGFGIAQAFSTFYKECHILRESDEKRRASWLELCRRTHAQLILVLGLLGVEVPERM